MLLRIAFSSLLLLCLAGPLWAMPPQEQTRVEALLQELGQHSELIFIRNNSEYSVAEVVSHLQRKLGYAANQLNSAEDFIDQLATRSSMSGQPYLVRWPDGHTQQLGPFLHQLLQKVDAPITK